MDVLLCLINKHIVSPFFIMGNSTSKCLPTSRSPLQPNTAEIGVNTDDADSFTLGGLASSSISHDLSPAPNGITAELGSDDDISRCGIRSGYLDSNGNINGAYALDVGSGSARGSNEDGGSAWNCDVSGGSTWNCDVNGGSACGSNGDDACGSAWVGNDGSGSACGHCDCSHDCKALLSYNGISMAYQRGVSRRNKNNITRALQRVLHDIKQLRGVVICVLLNIIGEHLCEGEDKALNEDEIKVIDNAWKNSNTPDVLMCLIANIFHKHGRQEELGPLPSYYTIPRKMRGPVKRKNKNKSWDTEDCTICQNRRGGCKCCTSCKNRNGECTCGKECTEHYHKCSTCDGCANNLCNCTCCGSCKNRNGECTCGKECTEHHHKCSTCQKCGLRLCDCKCDAYEWLWS